MRELVDEEQYELEKVNLYTMRGGSHDNTLGMVPRSRTTHDSELVLAFSWP